MKDLDGCGCCEGITAVTPETIESRPGLDAIKYRVGTHATFLETMEARLGQVTVTVDPGAPGARPLLALRTREEGDPAIATLDAWATVGDVLTFYQERIANEGYLRTALERRSLVELGRLVGYTPRPGVAASAFLAFSMQEGGVYDGVIPAGTRAQTLPKPGQTPQSFETSQPIEARAAFNLMKPALLKQQSFKNTMTLFLKGTNVNLAVNDPILVVEEPEKAPQPPPPKRTLFRVVMVTPDTALNRTAIELRGWRDAPADTAVGADKKSDKSAPDKAIDDLLAPPPAGAVPPSDPLAVAPSLEQNFASGSDALLRTIGGLRPDVKSSIYAALRGAEEPIRPKIRIYALRVKSGLFGGSASRQVEYDVDNHEQVTVLRPRDPKDWKPSELVTDGTRARKVPPGEPPPPNPEPPANPEQPSEPQPPPNPEQPSEPG